jgi:uncharacterized membrane protein
MSYLIVLTFDEADEAEKVRESLKAIQNKDMLSLDDSAVVVKDAEGKIHVKNEVDRGVAVGAIGGGILGILIAGVFFPVAGLLAGAAVGALLGKTFDMGIDKKFVQQVADELKPGNSAIFLIVRSSYPDAALSSLEQYKGHVYHTSLPSDAEDNLRKYLQ